jgi:hypothetical protein
MRIFLLCENLMVVYLSAYSLSVHWVLSGCSFISWGALWQLSGLSDVPCEGWIIARVESLRGLNLCEGWILARAESLRGLNPCEDWILARVESLRGLNPYEGAFWVIWTLSVCSRSALWPLWMLSEWALGSLSALWVLFGCFPASLDAL